jgi:hypothetical protein
MTHNKGPSVFVIDFTKIMVFEKKNTANWYGEQVFWGIYGHLLVLGFVQTGHGLFVPYTDRWEPTTKWPRDAMTRDEMTRSHF